MILSIDYILLKIRGNAENIGAKRRQYFPHRAISATPLLTQSLRASGFSFYPFSKKSYKKKTWSILCIAFIYYIQNSSVVIAQEKFVKRADKSFADKEYIAALDYYKQAFEENKQDAYINMRIAQSHLLSVAKTKSLQFASDALKYSTKPTSEIYFTLAEAFQINHQFDSAKYYFIKSEAGSNTKKITSKRIIECDNGNKYLANPVSAIVSNIGDRINTAYQDYLPYITSDQSRMYFTSRREGSTGGKKDNTGRYYEDIYTSRNIGGAWEPAENIGSPLNGNTHDACAGLSDDGQTMFVYKGSNGGDLYSSSLDGDNWTDPKPLTINTEFFESSASLSPDERTLYFGRKVMDGTRDIYSCSKTRNGEWSKARKLPISTAYDDDCPFIHPDGKTLYFSSKGHSSMGGYDVFKCTQNAHGVWSDPVNLGYPINSAGDDVYFILSADGKIGYYSSDKDGGKGQQDIYSIRMPAQVSPGLALLKGVVKEGEKNTPVEAEITITDNQSKEVVATFHSNKKSGEYLISLPSGRNYGIAVEKKGYLFHSENVYLSEKDGFKELQNEITLPSAKTGAIMILKNIFFDSGKYELRDESTSELEKLAKLLIANPSLKIEVSGHTDNMGNAQLNQQLSEQRANKVLQYLQNHKIEKSRLSAKGYGSIKPVATNDTEIGRQKNRRTEFRVL